MTKTRIGLFGIALALAAVAFLATGLMSEFRATRVQAAPNGKGHFRLEFDAKGVPTCYKQASGTTCGTKMSSLPTGETINFVTSLSVIKTTDAKGNDPCYVEHNGSYIPVPCN